MSTDHLTFISKEQAQTTSARQHDPHMEEALWKAFRKGDTEAYAAIYRQYFFVLYQYGKKICNDHELVKDAIQDLFIKIWNNRANLKATTSVKYYLLTSLKRKLLDTLRSPHLRLETEAGFSESDFFVTEDTTAEEELLARKEDVLKALNRLSLHQQQVLHLKFYKNCSNQQIAEEMGITIQSVYNAVFKTLKSLRNQLSLLISAILLHF